MKISKNIRNESDVRLRNDKILRVRDERILIKKVESQCPRFKESFYKILVPIRTLLSIPVKMVKGLQENILPSILFTQSYDVFSNFGFTREKMGKNILLAGMLGCIISKVWINPYLDRTQKDLNAVWLNSDNKTISDIDYDAQFYTCFWDFLYAVGMKMTVESINDILQTLLNHSIVLKKQSDFISEWLSNYNIYGVNIVNKNIYEEDSNAKGKRNIFKVLESIQSQSALITLWNWRINTLIDGATALYALYSYSPSITIPLYLGSIIVPQYIVFSLIYGIGVEIIYKILEYPSVFLLEKINRLKDDIMKQLNNIENNSELIAFLNGEEFEKNKTLELIHEENKQSKYSNLMKMAKANLREFISHIEWLIPILILLKSVRSDLIEKKSVISFGRQSMSISKCLSWSSRTFEKISEINSSASGLKQYEKRIEAWKVKREKIEKKVIDSETVGFSGTIYADEKCERILSKGKFILPKGSITHIDGPSGCGKTTLFRIFRGIWNDFDGEYTLPKNKTIFLPSQTYILGSEEPLLQTIYYPKKWINKDGTPKEEVNWVQNLLKTLNLSSNIYDKLINLSSIKDEKIRSLSTDQWLNSTSLSDGEKKRILFCNTLLKLKNEKIEFLVMDEPFKGVDEQTQKVMISLLKNEIEDGNSLSANCTVLFSNHEKNIGSKQNCGLNTHTLSIENETREFKFVAV